MPNPFGLVAGQTPQSDLASYYMTLNSVPKPHPAFIEYSGDWSPERGLTSVSAISKLFENDETAKEARELFDGLVFQLEKVYSEFLDMREMEDGTRSENYVGFLKSMISADRSYLATWCEKYGSSLDSDIWSITLALDPCGEDSSEVRIHYELFEEREPVIYSEQGISSL